MLSWQQHGRSHSISFVKYIAGAKFEEHCLNISMSYSQLNVNISQTKKDIPKGKTPFLLALKSLSNRQQLFLLHRHFNVIS